MAPTSRPPSATDFREPDRSGRFPHAPDILARRHASVLELSASQRLIGGKCVRTARLTKNDGAAREFFFEFSEDAPPGELCEFDAFVFGLVFLAMQEHADLRVRGPMTRMALRNLAEFQAVWSAWRPQRYQPIEIVPDSVVGPTPAHVAPRAIAAFSGGVDSVFTVLRHAGPEKSSDAFPLTDLLLVQGFDLGVDDHDAFERLRSRTRPLVENLGLQFRSVRTNLKRDSGQHWEDSFVAQLAACLHQHGPEFTWALLGSSEPYRSLCLPWGSNPITDPLLSNSRMSLVLDGCRFNRTEKIAAVAKHPLAVEGLNVCWEGASGMNCGHCEKCVRTRLNFLAAGIDSPACFSTPLELRDVARMRLRNHPQYHELVSLREHARRLGRTGPWTRAVDRRLSRYRIWDRWVNLAMHRLKSSRWIHLIRRVRSRFA